MSRLLFNINDIVREVEGYGDGAQVNGPAAIIKETRVVAQRDNNCMTATGHWYDRLTGASIGKQGTYRAIHSAGIQLPN